MDAAISVETVDAKGVAISAIIADAAVAGRGQPKRARWFLYEKAKALIDRLNPTPDEYENAIRLLSKALKI